MKITNIELLEIFSKSFKNNSIIKSIISNKSGDYEFTKINLKPIKIKENIFIQFEQFKDNKAFHSNLTVIEATKLLEEIILSFKQFLIITTDAEYQILKNKKGFTCKSKKTEKKEISLNHNKTKNYILDLNTPIPFLIRLGVMTKEGIVTKEKYNKFRQINKYLEFIEDTLKEMKDKKLVDNKIKVVDFGCGKSYLTFALYHYLKNIKNMDVDIIGIDLKEDVISHCNEIAKDLEFKNLNFLKGDIKNFDAFKDVDLIFSLHACNNATDYSILKGLELQAKAILAVPCCQSEFNKKIHASKDTEFKNVLSPFSNHGILQEKFSSLATDALRAVALELCGFNTKVMEFIDMEHTPKNILIKSVKGNISEEKLIAKKLEYDRYVAFLGIEPLITTLLKPYFLK